MPDRRPAPSSTVSAIRLILLALLLRGSVPVALAAQADPPEPRHPTALYGGMDYRMVGPFRGGRSTAVSGIPGADDSFLMGTTGGGLWRTDDAGASWTNITDGQLAVAPVGAVAVAPSDPSVVYLGTGSACIRGNISAGRGMYRSLDGGDTWTFAGLPEAGQIGDLAVHPRNADLVYVAAL
ncbi:MAG TPA: hypothetical protein VLL48_02690, partial [Longimicrobiales bacterium]|nr:hypothetical protein [Longimicrobiales bacterium]